MSTNLSVQTQNSVTGSTRKPAGRPPVLALDGSNFDKVAAYHTGVGREIPAPKFGKGRTTAEEKARRDDLRAKVQKFNAKIARAD